MTAFGSRVSQPERPALGVTGHAARYVHSRSRCLLQLPTWGIAGVHHAIRYEETTRFCGVRLAAVEDSSAAAAFILSSGEHYVDNC